MANELAVVFGSGQHNARNVGGRPLRITTDVGKKTKLRSFKKKGARPHKLAVQ